jgi:hypothetical protein
MTLRPPGNAGTLLFFLALGAGSCATSLSTFQPAHVAPKGHVQAEAGFDVSVPTRTLGSTIDAARTAARAARTRELSEEERRQLLDAGLLLAIDPPFFVSHVGVAFTPIEGFELGLRYTSHAWRLGTRLQVKTLERDGYDLTLGLGVQRFVFDVPGLDLVDYVEIDDFVRWNFDLPILFGTRGPYHRLWGGPRVVASRFDARIAQELPPVGGRMIPPVEAAAQGRALYLGAQGGVAVGYKRVFVGFELTLVRQLGSADLNAGEQAARTVDLDGWVVYPGVALMGEF